MASNEVIMTRFKEDAARARERLTAEEYADCVAYVTDLGLSEEAPKKRKKSSRSSKKGKGKAKAAVESEAVDADEGAGGAETTTSVPEESDRIRPTVTTGSDIVVVARNTNKPDGSLFLTKTTGAADVGQGLEAPGLACTEDGCECQHTPWPTLGVITIRKCNIVCEVCGLFSSEFGIKNGKGAANLRRHVVQKHCTDSKGAIRGKTAVARLYDSVEKKWTVEVNEEEVDALNEDGEDLGAVNEDEEDLGAVDEDEEDVDAADEGDEGEEGEEEAAAINEVEKEVAIINEGEEEVAALNEDEEAPTAEGPQTTSKQPATSKRPRHNDNDEGVPGPSTKKTRQSKRAPAKGKTSISKASKSKA